MVWLYLKCNLKGAMMSKELLVDAIVNQSGVTKKAAEEAIKMVTSGIESVLAQGNDVNLIGFGKFEVKTRAARTGRNPATGAPLEIKEAKVASFKVGKKLKDAVNN